MNQEAGNFPMDGELKNIEQKIINFYEHIGTLSGLNSKSTTIFAYFQVYGTLTQNELHSLTKFSTSTISTTLQAFLQTEIINQENIPGSRKYRYRCRPEKTTFIYAVFTDIMENLENFNDYILDFLARLEGLKQEHSTDVAYLTFRLNSYRNYIEAQRRAILNQSKSEYFTENIRILYPHEQNLFPSIDYSPEITQIETEFIEILIRNNIGAGNNPIINKIFGYFYSRGSLNQQQLQELTGFSLSTISRIVTRNTRNHFLKSYPKSYQKPRIYYLESPALAIIDQILQIDNQIFQNKKMFEELLETLNDLKKGTDQEKWVDFFIDNIHGILEKIEKFKVDSERLNQARKDLAQFIANK